MSKSIQSISMYFVSFILFVSMGYLLLGLVGSFLGFVFFGFLLLISYFISDKYLIWLYGLKKLPEDKYKKLYTLLPIISKKSEISVPKLYLSDVSTPYAFVFGMRNVSYIAVSSGLIQLCDEKEIEAVMYREISQIRSNEFKNNLLISIFFSLLFYPFEVLWWHGVNNKGKLNDVFKLPAVIVAPVIVFILNLYRVSESVFKVDSNSVKLSKKSKCLSLALDKMAREVKFRPLKAGSHVTSSFFMVNPFNGSYLSRSFLIHPNVKVRISRLDKLSL